MFGLFKKNTTLQANPDLDYIISTVRYSTEPHDDIPFSEEERTFFKSLIQQFKESGLNPKDIRLTRMSSMGFNVDTHDCYVGKINFYVAPDKFAVIKNGGKRAAKIFDTKEEADAYITEHEGYFIDIRTGENRRYMQYLKGANTVKELHNPTLEECIVTIPRWITYIKYCKRNK